MLAARSGPTTVDSAPVTLVEPLERETYEPVMVCRDVDTGMGAIESIPMGCFRKRKE